MPEPYAELIGDPVAHSLSPAIHARWLNELALAGDFRAFRCEREELSSYLGARRHDPFWRGCNVTMPLKAAAATFADEADATVTATGAANCLARQGDRLMAYNTDLDGIDAALGDLQLKGERAVLIGAGGAARAAVAALGRRGARVLVLARDPARALSLLPLAPSVRAEALYANFTAIDGAAAVINATPLGMEGAPPMAWTILETLNRAAPGALIFDMVYRPVDTALLTTARSAGLHTADGLTMLIGQARRAFELFFGMAPPPGDDDLRRALLRAG